MPTVRFTTRCQATLTETWEAEVTVQQLVDAEGPEGFGELLHELLDSGGAVHIKDAPSEEHDREIEHGSVSIDHETLHPR